ncbi:MAG: hypothetical protein H0Z34_16935 [Brevibacillus sp.]|nr:hypothetical protein [Brevibacillus sp.]
MPLTFLGCFNLTVMAISEQLNNAAVKSMLYTTEGICVFAGTLLARRIARKRITVSIMLGCASLIGLSHLSLAFADRAAG